MLRLASAAGALATRISGDRGAAAGGLRRLRGYKDAMAPHCAPRTGCTGCCSSPAGSVT